MRILIMISLIIMLAGMAFVVPGASAVAVDVGSSISVGPDGYGKGSGAENMSAMQNMTKKQEGNQSMNQTQEQEMEQNETGHGKPETENGKGVSEQVHQIIEQRKSGSITVPQGLVVRIIARNQTMTVEQAILRINETIRANVRIQGRNRTLTLEPEDEAVNITDEGVTVETNETIEIVNDTLSVAGKKVLIMPSAVPQKIKTKTIRSAVLHVADGDPVYSVNATRKAKVLWIFDAEMDVEVELDAASGQVKNERRPWWSFLAGVQEEE